MAQNQYVVPGVSVGDWEKFVAVKPEPTLVPPLVG